MDDFPDLDNLPNIADVVAEFLEEQEEKSNISPSSNNAQLYNPVPVNEAFAFPHPVTETSPVVYAPLQPEPSQSSDKNPNEIDPFSDSFPILFNPDQNYQTSATEGPSDHKLSSDLCDAKEKLQRDAYLYRLMYGPLTIDEQIHLKVSERPELSQRMENIVSLAPEVFSVQTIRQDWARASQRRMEDQMFRNAVQESYQAQKMSERQSRKRSHDIAFDRWSLDDSGRLKLLGDSSMSWKDIQTQFPGRTAEALRKRYRRMGGNANKTNMWTPEEDHDLENLYVKHKGDFSKIASEIPRRKRALIEDRWNAHHLPRYWKP